MMSAARKLQSAGFAILLLAIFGLIYPLSLQVATTRSDVLQVERDIRRTRENIRYLETELGARASLRQLERWNAEVFGYAAPTASQYLAGEQELASANSRELKGGMPIVAPVLTAMSTSGATSGATSGQDQTSDDNAPAVAPQGLAIAQQVSAPQPRTNTVVMATRAAPTAPVRVQSVQIVPSAQAAMPKPKTPAKAATPANLARIADQRRAERTAMLEGQLLSPETMAQIERGARAERSRVERSRAERSRAERSRAVPSGAAKVAVGKPAVAKPAVAKPATVKPAVKPTAKPAAKSSAAKPAAKPVAPKRPQP